MTVTLQNVLNQVSVKVNKKIKIVGPCSKYINGQGWTTEVKLQYLIDLLKKEGYIVTKENSNEMENKAEC